MKFKDITNRAYKNVKWSYKIKLIRDESIRLSSKEDINHHLTF